MRTVRSLRPALAAAGLAVALGAMALPLGAAAQNLRWAEPAAPAQDAQDATNPQLPDAPTAVPIDGGLAVLAFAGVSYAAYRLRRQTPVP